MGKREQQTGTETTMDGKFEELGLSEAVLKGVEAAGFETPTPIQVRAIPALLAGKDLVAQAQTGTGKTAAFALPLVDRLDPAQGRPQALILCPTRELAVQVSEAIYMLGRSRGFRVLPIYGGQPIDRQLRGLRAGTQIVVGTPGRLLDHLRRGTLDLTSVKTVVLDEADEMLAMGFIEDIELILDALPEERQIGLFSATIPPPIARLATRYLKDPERITIAAEAHTVPQIRQCYYEVLPAHKVDALTRILDMETPGPTIIFCRTKRECDELGEHLRGRGYGAEALHGDLTQAERDRVMRRFRQGQVDLLVATDVAARGLDIETVTHVINYDIPWDAESYTHRIGRTGRAGREGDAITLVSPRERRQLKLIERGIGTRIVPVRLPTAADIAARRRDLFKQSVIAALEDGEFDDFLMTVEELADDYGSSEIAAAALKLLWVQQKNEVAAQETDGSDGARPEQGMARLFLTVGREHGLRPTDLVGAIANEAGLPGNAIGAIDIMDRCSFVEVPIEAADRVVKALSRTRLRGHKARIEKAPDGAENFMPPVEDRGAPPRPTKEERFSGKRPGAPAGSKGKHAPAVGPKPKHPSKKRLLRTKD
jgi:ATP-dependent RNA helicase DeaD